MLEVYQKTLHSSDSSKFTQKMCIYISLSILKCDGQKGKKLKNMNNCIRSYTHLTGNKFHQAQLNGSESIALLS